MVKTPHLSRSEFLKGLGVAMLGLTAKSASGQTATSPTSEVEAATPSAVTKPSAPRSRLILLGTGGGPVLRKKRFQPSNLLIVDGAPYLIDAGYGCLQQLRQVGFDAHDLAGIFITHHHTDHNIDLASIINFSWTGGRRTPLLIYGPPRTKEIVDAALTYFNAAARVSQQQFKSIPPATSFVRARDIAGAGLAFTDTRIRVTAAENTHYQTFTHGANKSYTYRIECADRTFVFSGDTGPSEDVTRLARGADILVSEVVDVPAATEAGIKENRIAPDLAGVMADHMRLEHLPAEDLGKMAQKAGVRMVVLSHFVPGADSEEDPAVYISGVRKHYGGIVVPGRDLAEF